MNRYKPATDEYGEPIACQSCDGTGIPQYGPVEGRCPACGGSGRERVIDDDWRDEDFEREARYGHG